MHTCFFRTVLVIATAVPSISTYGQTVLLFGNDFSAPAQTPVPNCGPDLDATLLNTLWGGTGAGTGGGGLWDQINTVETILINGPGNTYTDADTIGGDYCLSMLSTFQDDKAALTLNSQGLPFVNLYMDISSIDVVACGGPFGVAQPTFHITVYDAPGAYFNFSAPGAILDQDTLVGNEPGVDPYTFTWAHVSSGYDVSGSTDGWVTVVLDLLTSGYAAFDNIEINASVSAAGLNDVHAANGGVRVWPDPVADMLHLSRVNAGTSWTIVNMAGEGVMTGSSTPTQGLDVSALAPGLYVLRLASAGTQHGLRFVKD